MFSLFEYSLNLTTLKLPKKTRMLQSIEEKQTHGSGNGFSLHVCHQVAGVGTLVVSDRRKMGLKEERLRCVCNGQRELRLET